jgi:hypothetical protein
MKRWWISWYQPTDDWRPLRFPPPNVLGYWCSGYDENDVPILVALVEGDDPYAVVWKQWPEAERWRFCEDVAADWRPGDRFMLPDWSPLLKEAE